MIEVEDIGLFVFYFMNISILILSYNEIDVKYFKTRAGIIFILIDYIFSILNYLFDVDMGVYYTIQSAFLLFFLFCKCFSSIKSDELNSENVCLIFYKPKKLKQFLLSVFGLSYSSAGLVIGGRIYQMRYEAGALQEIPFKDGTEEYLREKYLIIDTGFKSCDLRGDWRSELLSQRARQARTLYLRFNCLRSLRFVLNQIPGFKYYGEVFPCLYLLRLKVVKIISSF